LTDAEGQFNGKIYVAERGAKYGKPRTLPLREEVTQAVKEYVTKAGIVSGPIFYTQRGEPCTSNVVQKQIKAVYAACGYKGARSHSGRRSAITLMARNANSVDASLEDIRIWAGHAHIGTTGLYVDPSPRAEELTKLL
jgi:integrase/recombinase XerD